MLVLFKALQSEPIMGGVGNNQLEVLSFGHSCTDVSKDGISPSCVVRGHPRKSALLNAQPGHHSLSHVLRYLIPQIYNV